METSDSIASGPVIRRSKSWPQLRRSPGNGGATEGQSRQFDWKHYPCLQNLPVEVLLRISQFLSTMEHAYLTLVCRRLMAKLGNGALQDVRSQTSEHQELLDLLHQDFDSNEDARIPCAMCCKMHRVRHLRFNLTVWGGMPFHCILHRYRPNSLTIRDHTIYYALGLVELLKARSKVPFQSTLSEPGFTCWDDDNGLKRVNTLTMRMQPGGKAVIQDQWVVGPTERFAPRYEGLARFLAPQARRQLCCHMNWDDFCAWLDPALLLGHDPNKMKRFQGSANLREARGYLAFSGPDHLQGKLSYYRELLNCYDLDNICGLPLGYAFLAHHLNTVFACQKCETDACLSTVDLPKTVPLWDRSRVLVFTTWKLVDLKTPGNGIKVGDRRTLGDVYGAYHSLKIPDGCECILPVKRMFPFITLCRMHEVAVQNDEQKERVQKQLEELFGYCPPLHLARLIIECSKGDKK